MGVDVDPVPVTDGDSMQARVYVTTTDAAGTSREYDIKLTADYVDTDDDESGYVLAGSRIDEGASSEELAGGGVSETAWQAAAAHLTNEAGYEVFGR